LLLKFLNMKYDIIIIGGGIVGLATANRLKEKSPDLKIAVLEKEKTLAAHQTGNNSGVIHAGVYYKPGSLKATNNQQGYRQLIEFCDKENIPYNLCGKLIVATHKNQLERLENLYKRGLQNGLDKIKKLPQEEIGNYEPHVKGVAAIWVPYTGIIDYKQVAEKYGEIFRERHGGDIFLQQKVTGIHKYDGYNEVITPENNFEARLVINTAGLYADKIAALNTKNLRVKILPFRGEYYLLRPDREYLVKGLIYPVPDPAFPVLGVHFTKKLTGGVEAGPNAVLAFKREGYRKTDFSFSEASDFIFWRGFLHIMRKHWKMGIGEYYRSFNKTAFTHALQKLVPELQKDDLIAGGAGVRALAADRDGGIIDDFMFVEEKGILNVLNAPSPAATASLSVGNTIAGMALKMLS
jgi:(S)-2-hydroxyglutarate dehydrogenase